MLQKRVLALIFWCFFIFRLFAQTVVSGVVIDKETKESIPFVNISALPSYEGTSSNFDGEFSIKSSKSIIELRFTYIGYETYVYKLKAGVNKDLVIELNPAGIQIEETTVLVKKNKKNLPKDTIALSLQQLVVDNKENNRPKSFDSYYYKEHNIIEFDYYKLKESFEDRKIFKPFRVIFNYIDTMPDSARFLPLLLQEKMSEHFVSQNPNQEKNIVLGQYMTGIQNMSTMVILDDIFESFDLYDNIIIAGGKSFPSPFSDAGLLTYRFYLTDSIIEGNSTFYKLDFTPKSKESIAFNGYAYIDKKTYAIKAIEFSLPKQANLNFVGEFKVKQVFEQVDTGKWMLNAETIQIALNPTGKPNGRSLMVTKNMERDGLEVNVDFPSKIFEGEKIILQDSLEKRSKEWWAENRIQELSDREFGVVEMSDSIERTKAFKNYTWLGGLASSAFLKAGPVEFGRFYQFVSWNSIEGIRPKMGIRTNRDFSDRIQLWSYVAYGTKDKAFKSFANVRIMLPKVNNNWHTLELNYKKDFTFLGQDYEDQQFSHDNMFLAILSTSPLTKIMLMENLKVTHERQWVNGYTTKIMLGTTTFFAVDDVFEFQYQDNEGITQNYDKFNVAEIGIDQHFGFGQKFFENTFYRFEGFSKKPVVDLSYKIGLKNIAGGDYAYHKLELEFRQRLSTKLGYTYYNFLGGVIFGDAPYPIMFIPIGTQNLYYNFGAYQTMRPFEYAADKYGAFWLEHHFDGLVLNRIPGIKKLKLRGVVVAKTLIGGAKQSNIDLINLPADMTVPSQLFAEVGFGIENILQLLRVDCIWRLTQRDKLDVQKFAIRFAIVPKL